MLKYIRQFKAMRLPFVSINDLKEVESKDAPTAEIRIEGKVYPYRQDHAKIKQGSPSHPKVAERAIYDPSERKAIQDFFSSRNKDAQIRRNEDRSKSKKDARFEIDSAKSHEERVHIFDRRQFYENWMAKVWHLYLVALTGGWTPKIDITSDHAGANSQTLFYMDANLDASKQKEAIKGKDVTSNPPYKDPKPIIKALEKAFAENKSTRAYLWVPERPRRQWFRALIASKVWRLIAYFPPGEDLFSQPKCQ